MCLSQLATSAGMLGAAAADAFADDDQAGLGGWWIEPGAELHLRNIQYFSISVQLRDLPVWFSRRWTRASETPVADCSLRSLGSAGVIGV